MDINFIRDLAGVMQEYNLNRRDVYCEKNFYTYR